MQRTYFGTDGIRGKTGTLPITPEFALKLGWAVGQVMAQDGKGSVVIGKDTRISGYLLASALESGFIAAGLDVVLLGPMPTPGVAYLTQALQAQVGVVISASHNPYYDNGFKFFDSKGKKLSDNVEQTIESILSLPMTMVDAHALGRARHHLLGAKQYITFCKSTFSQSENLQGMKIVVDCANGATYHIAPHVFSELGADVITIHHQPDGLNINAQCGSTHPQALQAAVVTHQADLGIAFDGDGDRLIMVDHLGEIVDGDELLFIIASGYHTQGILKGVVGTQMSNLGLEMAFRAINIPFMRSKVGDRYVMDALSQTGWELGGEGSGHIICLDKTTTGDGIIAALQVLRQLRLQQVPLHNLKKGMSKYAQILLNVPVANAQGVVADSQVQNACAQAEQELQQRGRILLRPSGTEPLVRVMAEGEDQTLISRIAQNIADIVEKVAIAQKAV